VVADPNGLQDEDFEELLDEGFNWTEVAEIIAVVDMATMFNIYTSSLKLDLDRSSGRPLTPTRHGARGRFAAGVG
jgi:hypothetical protein